MGHFSQPIVMKGHLDWVSLIHGSPEVVWESGRRSACSLSRKILYSPLVDLHFNPYLVSQFPIFHKLSLLTWYSVNKIGCCNSETMQDSSGKCRLLNKGFNQRCFHCSKIMQIQFVLVFIMTFFFFFNSFSFHHLKTNVSKLNISVLFMKLYNFRLNL